MTFAGADSETRNEMARVLHFPNDGDVPASFFALQQSLEQMSAKTEELVKDSKKFRRPERANHVEHCQPALCTEGVSFSRSVPVIGKTEFWRSIRAARFRC